MVYLMNGWDCKDRKMVVIRVRDLERVDVFFVFFFLFWFFNNFGVNMIYFVVKVDKNL